MSKKSPTRSLVNALGTTFAVTLAASPMVHADGNPFSAVEFQGGYMLAAEGGEAGCGAAMQEGKCGAGSDQAEGTAAKSTDAAKNASSKDGEHTCGGDGAGKAAEGKCGS